MIITGSVKIPANFPVLWVCCTAKAVRFNGWLARRGRELPDDMRQVGDDQYDCNDEYNQTGLADFWLITHGNCLLLLEQQLLLERGR
ncbi:hypothetical protein B9K09_09320 [Pseudomonas sp. M30-35]|nr:hypothetical protein B9K09_09320 [Pseudomonas sp. M30-35]